MQSLFLFVSTDTHRAFRGVSEKRSWILRSMTLDCWISVNALHLCFYPFYVSLFHLFLFWWWMLKINEKQFHNFFRACFVFRMKISIFSVCWIEKPKKRQQELISCFSFSACNWNFKQFVNFFPRVISQTQFLSVSFSSFHFFRLRELAAWKVGQKRVRIGNGARYLTALTLSPSSVVEWGFYFLLFCGRMRWSKTVDTYQYLSIMNRVGRFFPAWEYFSARWIVEIETGIVVICWNDSLIFLIDGLKKLVEFLEK